MFHISKNPKGCLKINLGSEALESSYFLSKKKIYFKKPIFHCVEQCMKWLTFRVPIFQQPLGRLHQRVHRI